MDRLPIELLEKIFGYLTVRQFLSVRAVCRAWSHIKYPHPTQFLSIRCSLAPFRLVLYSLAFSDKFQWKKHKKINYKRVANHTLDEGLDLLELMHCTATMELVLPESLRYLKLTKFVAPMVVWSNVMHLVLRNARAIVRPSWLPMGLVVLRASDCEFADEPLPESVVELRIDVLAHSSFLHEGLYVLFVDEFGDEDVYRMPSTLRHLDCKAIVPSVVLNDELKYLCYRAAGPHAMPRALKTIEFTVREPSDVWPGMFDAGVHDVTVSLLDGGTNPLIGVFRAHESLNLTLRGLYWSLRIVPGIMPSTLVNLTLDIEGDEVGDLFAPGALPPSLRRLKVLLNVSTESSLRIENMPEDLLELEIVVLNYYHMKPLVDVLYPPKLRVLCDDYRGVVPESLEKFTILGITAGYELAIVLPEAPKLKYVELVDDFKEFFTFPPHVRVTYI